MSTAMGESAAVTESKVKRPLAVVTGATSGIGAEFARRLAAEGYDLLLTGRRAEKIAGLARELAGRNRCRVETVICELANPDDLERLIRRLEQRPEIALLVNNAGFGLDTYFAETELGPLVDMVRVHSEAPVRIMRAVIPLMRQRGAGAIINVSSVSGYAPGLGNAVYSATKAFLTTLSESLYQELLSDGIVVQALLPGFTQSDFHTRMEERKSPGGTGGNGSGPVSARTAGLPYMSSEKVVSASLRALHRRLPVCVPGFTYRALVAFLRLAPRRVRFATMRVREKRSR